MSESGSADAPVTGRKGGLHGTAEPDGRQCWAVSCRRIQVHSQARRYALGVTVRPGCDRVPPRVVTAVPAAERPHPSRGQIVTINHRQLAPAVTRWHRAGP